MLFIENVLEHQEEKLQVSAQQHQESPHTRLSHPRAGPLRRLGRRLCPRGDSDTPPPAAAGSQAAAHGLPWAGTCPRRRPAQVTAVRQPPTAPPSGSARPPATGCSGAPPRLHSRHRQRPQRDGGSAQRSRWKPLSGCRSMETETPNHGDCKHYGEETDRTPGAARPPLERPWTGGPSGRRVRPGRRSGDAVGAADGENPERRTETGRRNPRPRGAHVPWTVHGATGPAEPCVLRASAST